MIHSISKMEQSFFFYYFFYRSIFQKKRLKNFLLCCCCIFDAKWNFFFTLYNNALLCSFYCLVMKSFYSNLCTYRNFVSFIRGKYHTQKISIRSKKKKIHVHKEKRWMKIHEKCIMKRENELNDNFYLM